MAQLLPLPLDSGGKIKSYHMLKALAEKHRVTLVSFIRTEEEKRYLGHLHNLAEKIIPCLIKRSFYRNSYEGVKCILTGKSFIVSRDFVGEMKGKINQTLFDTDYDVIHIDHLQMAQYVNDGVANGYVVSSI